MKTGEMVSVKELQKNDMFFMKYGFSILKFRVNVKLENGVLAHSLKWLKQSSIFIGEDTPEIYYAGRMNKIKGWLML